MDEHNRGMGPDVRHYFRKIMNSFSYGLMWMISAATAGLYFRLAFFDEGLKWYNILFYVLVLSTFVLLLRYYYRTWRK